MNSGGRRMNHVGDSESYCRLRVIAKLRHDELYHSANIVSSIEFDSDDEMFATAGVSRRIKVFNFLTVNISFPLPSIDMLLQQRNQSYLDERHMASVTSSNYMKPNLSTSLQVAAAPTNDPVNIPKPPQNVVSSSYALANSATFVRPSRTPTSARFSSALNIETLVAAAERRETPIEAPPS
nr:CCR4-Not transcription complex subunit 1 isoform X1 [Tanacetum cinerariifolium]